MKKSMLTGILVMIGLVLGALFVYAATAPTVTLTSPSDDSSDTDGNIDFTYSVSDDLNNVTSCTLYINSAADTTDDSITIGSNTFQKTGYTDGTNITWNVQCTDNESLTGTASSNRDVFVRFRRLIVDDLKVYVDGEKHSGIDEDCVDETCDIDDDVFPGSEIKIVIKFENTYDDNEDVDIEDIEVDAVLEEIDDGDDIDENADISKLKSEDKESVTLIFNVPREVDEGEYDLVIDVDAEDEDNNDQGFSFDFDVKVEKKSHKIEIDKAELDQSTLSCSRSTDLEVRLINVGSNDEDEVELKIENDALGIDIHETSIPEIEAGDADDDTTWSRTFDIDVPSDAEEGSYILTVTAFYSEDVHSDEKELSLVVENCGTAEEEEEEEEEEEIEVVADKNASQLTVPPQISQDLGVVETTETSFFDSTAYMVILVTAIVVAIGAGVFVVVKFLIFKP